MFIVKDIGKLENTKFLLLFFSSATSLLIAIGKPSCAIAINNMNVGVMSIYTPSPSTPINLLVTILIIIPSIFVIAPPSIKISVDFTNLFFTFSP